MSNRFQDQSVGTARQTGPMTPDPDNREPLTITGYLPSSLTPNLQQPGKITVTLQLSRFPTEFEAAHAEGLGQSKVIAFDLSDRDSTIRISNCTIEKLPEWIITLNQQLDSIESEAARNEREWERTIAAAMTTLEGIAFDA